MIKSGHISKLLSSVFTFALVITGCATRQIDQNANEALANEAVRMIAKWNATGKLPGMMRNEVEEFETGAIPQGNEVVYPFSIDIKATAKSGHVRNTYKLTKDSNAAEWRITGGGTTTTSTEK